MTLQVAERGRVLALQLYALAAEDRHWLLGQLDDASQVRMTALLDEIAELGLKVESGIIDDVIESRVTDPQAKNDNAWSSFRVVNRIRADWLISLFRPEPVAIASIISGLHAWSWLQDPAWQAWRAPSDARIGAPNPTLRVKRTLASTIARRAEETSHLSMVPESLGLSTVSTQSRLVRWWQCLMRKVSWSR